MPIEFHGVGSHWDRSDKIRAELVQQDKPILLSFSRGKDALACWLGLLDSGMKPEHITPIYYYGVPGLEFVENSLQKYEEFFQTQIHRLPHPELYRQLGEGCYQPVHRTGALEAMDLPKVSFEDIQDAFREQQGLDPETPILTGVRAADSIARRTYLKKSGPYSAAKKRLAAIWDWTQPECYERISAAGIDLAEYSPDYKMFVRYAKSGKPVKNSGRTLDGIAYQFLKPLKEHYPRDYATTLKWFPLAEMDMIRHEQL